MCSPLVFLFLFGYVQISLELGIENLLFIIVSQNNPYNDELANSLEHSLQEQSKQLNTVKPIRIYISNKYFNTSADWTIATLVIPILDIVEQSTQWIVFLEDRTNVNIKLLLGVLEGYDHETDIWVGHALYDSDATIIHHFAFHEDPTFFKYPNLASGFGLSVPLLKKVKSILEAVSKAVDFHIDPSHEFALLVYNNGEGPMMQHNDFFCATQRENCATFPTKFKSCGDIHVPTIYFAIKTCKKFHESRVQAVKDTWWKYTKKSGFFSDFEDSIIPTISIGIPNTEHGHCLKTLAIFNYTLKVFKEDPKLQWLALVDDDTILSVSRIAQLVTCHNNASHPLILGERYRFGVQGFNYPTGGAGILINRAALQILASKCYCPRVDSPDDMVIGACAQENGIVLVHIPQLHQARPPDYAAGRLATKDSITFHKHWMLNPIETYREWFLQDDQAISEKSDFINAEL